jgi:hypothetical protein
LVERLRSWLPLLHDFVQAAHELKPPTTQSRGHACELQACNSDVVGQVLPPKLGGVHARVRRWVPPSHDRVQVPQPAQLPTTASTHSMSLQLRVSAVCEQAAPPHWRLRSTERLRLWKPVPHDLEQGDQLPKPRMTHGAGQHWVLQARVSATWPWALPPHFGAVAVRERSCEPPAHTLVQPDQPPHEPLRPSTGQHTALQSRVSLRYGHR